MKSGNLQIGTSSKTSVSITRTKVYLNIFAIVSFMGLITYLLHEREKIEIIQPPTVHGTQTIINQDEYGNFLAMGTINNIDVSMLIDTGASTVVISDQLVSRIGPYKKKAIRVATANGVTEGYLTTLKVIRIGNLVGENIEAVIVPNLQIPHILLGMSFLKKVNFEKHGNQLILSPIF